MLAQGPKLTHTYCSYITILGFFLFVFLSPQVDFQTGKGWENCGIDLSEVDKLKILSGKLNFRSNSFCQISWGQPSPDPLTVVLYSIFKQQFLQICDHIAQNMKKYFGVPIILPNFLQGGNISPQEMGKLKNINLMKFKLIASRGLLQSTIIKIKFLI